LWLKERLCAFVSLLAVRYGLQGLAVSHLHVPKGGPLKDATFISTAARLLWLLQLWWSQLLWQSVGAT
jgi:hypothetical protein